jgi:hypothetical protein
MDAQCVAQMSQEGRAAALAAADKEQEGYPKDLESLCPQVEARVKHVVYELGREVDETFQAVADKGLHEAYRKYAKKFKRPWAAKASKKVSLFLFSQAAGASGFCRPTEVQCCEDCWEAVVWCVDREGRTSPATIS